MKRGTILYEYKFKNVSFEKKKIIENMSPTSHIDDSLTFFLMNLLFALQPKYASSD